MLTSRQIAKYITGPITEKNIQQVGVDLNLISVARLDGGFSSGGRIGVDVTTLAKRVDLDPEDLGNGVRGWNLVPGMYDITLAQGCDIPNNIALLIRQRSSLLRNGALLHSSVFDPGFKTNNIGTILFVHEPLTIEFAARVCQIYGYKLDAEVADQDLYGSASKGSQWQGDRQRSQSPDELDFKLEDLDFQQYQQSKIKKQST